MRHPSTLLLLLAACAADRDGPGNDPTTGPAPFEGTWDFGTTQAVAQAVTVLRMTSVVPSVVQEFASPFLEPGCPEIVDLGGDSYRFDATGCADGSMTGTLQADGLVRDGTGALGFGNGAEVTLTATGFTWNLGMYQFEGIDGTVVVVGASDGSWVASGDLVIAVDASFTPAILPDGAPAWPSGTYTFTDYTTELSFPDQEVSLRDHGVLTWEGQTAQVDLEVSDAGGGLCALGDGFWNEAAATLVGSNTATVTWDATSACDGCVPYTLGDGSSGSFCD